jgi:hypothetical protein
MHLGRGARVDIPVSISAFLLFLSLLLFYFSSWLCFVYGVYHCEYMVIPFPWSLLVSFWDVIELTRNDELLSHLNFTCVYVSDIKEILEDLEGGLIYICDLFFLYILSYALLC